jgi:ADP-ribosyl-[dinitrogen reductase] hydrolase
MMPLQHNFILFSSSCFDTIFPAAGGRCGLVGSVVGDVILKGKRQYWGRPNMHYHNGMRAGENTLNALLARLVVRNLARTRMYSPQAFIKDYIAFMTSPDSHNDTYAESYHIDFFANYTSGVPPMQCAGKESHDAASIGGIILVSPVVLFTYVTTKNRMSAAEAGMTQIRLTHRSVKLDQYAAIYIGCLVDILCGVSVLEATQYAGVSSISVNHHICLNAYSTGSKIGVNFTQIVARSHSDRDVCGGMFGLACHIEHSLPVLLFLAHKVRFESCFSSHDDEASTN